MLFPRSDLIEVGVDEAGRGPLAFEVVAAAVIMPSETEYTSEEDHKLMPKIRDSKKVSKKMRQTLADYIKRKALAYGIGIATVAEIDQHNILNATYMAMHRALDQVRMKRSFDHIWVDGDRFKPYMDPSPNASVDWVPHTTCVKGDDTHLNIAAASILAKVTRDTMVETYVAENLDWKEMYGFHTNMGYGTAKHIQGIRTHGITPHHRLTFTRTTVG